MHARLAVVPRPVREPEPRPVVVELLDQYVAALKAERDAYRAQATAAVEALIDLGHEDVATRIVGE